MRNKIVDYYTPDDERLDEYYTGHSKLLGLDKCKFGLDEGGVLRFESNYTDSKIWKRYKELGGSEDETGDLNTLWGDFHNKKFSINEMMQWYREIGYSLCGFVDVWSGRFYDIEDKKEFEKALVELKGIEHLENAKEHILEEIFLAHLNSIEDELVFKYRKRAKTILNKNFGPESWDEFIESIKSKRNER